MRGGREIIVHGVHRDAGTDAEDAASGDGQGSVWYGMGDNQGNTAHLDRRSTGSLTGIDEPDEAAGEHWKSARSSDERRFTTLPSSPNRSGWKAAQPI